MFRPRKTALALGALAALMPSASPTFASLAGAQPIAPRGAAVVPWASSSSCSGVKLGGSFTWGLNDDVIDMDPDSTQDPTSIQAELASFDQLVRLNPRVRPRSRTWRSHGASAQTARSGPSTSDLASSSQTGSRSLPRTWLGRLTGTAHRAPW